MNSESSTDFELPRFSRQIGITGLRGVGEHSGRPSSICVVSPFAGVLDTTVRQDRSHGTIPQLAYLTLAPLVTRELTTTDERTAQSERTGRDIGASTESDEGTDEPRVREVLREMGPEQSATEPTPSADRNLNHLSTIDAAGTGGDLPIPSEEWLDSVSGADHATPVQPEAVPPSMIYLDDPRAGRDENRSDSGGQPFVMDDIDPDSVDITRESPDPDLTVRRTGQSARTSRTTDPGNSTVTAQATSPADQRPGTPPEGSGSSPTRTVIAADGSVNHRVLDRLYQELTRKRRIEHSREGR